VGGDERKREGDGNSVRANTFSNPLVGSYIIHYRLDVCNPLRVEGIEKERKKGEEQRQEAQTGGPKDVFLFVKQRVSIPTLLIWFRLS